MSLNLAISENFGTNFITIIKLIKKNYAQHKHNKLVD